MACAFDFYDYSDDKEGKWRLMEIYLEWLIVIGYSWFEITRCRRNSSLCWFILSNYLASIRSNSSKTCFRYSLSTRGNSSIILHRSIPSIQANPDVEIHPHREECRGEYTTYWFLLLVVYKGLLMVGKRKKLKDSIWMNCSSMAHFSHGQLVMWLYPHWMILVILV